MTKKNNKKGRIIKNDNHLMNTLMYDALKSAGVKEEEARATALEAGQNDLRFLAVEHAFDKLYSHVDRTAADLRKDMADLRTDIIENENRNANRQLENANRNSRSNLTIMLGTVAVGVGFLSMLMVILP